MLPIRFAALAAILSLFALSPGASAVYLNPDGLGQALIYPHYTVRSVGGNPFNTYIAIGNTGEFGSKVMRVRFREGRNGREVAGFNLYLGQRDMWTAAIVPDGEGAKLISADRSCVDPAMTTAAPNIVQMAFSAASYTGANDDGQGSGLDRVREGYVEVIEMATFPVGSDSDVAVTFVNEAPDDCPFVRNFPDLVRFDARAPTGLLWGSTTLINVASGMDFTVNAEALEGLATQQFFRVPADPYPDFDAAEVTPLSVLIAGDKQYRLAWSRGVDAVSSVLMQTGTVNEYVLDQFSASRTDWILTLPTRRFYRGTATPTAPPFGSFGGSEGCEHAVVQAFNRESWHLPEYVCQFALCPTPPPEGRICHASSAWTVRNGGSYVGPVVGSANISSPDTELEVSAFGNQRNGWVRLQYPGNPASITGLVSQPSSSSLDLNTGAAATGSFRVLGMPVLGFMARTFSNGTLQCSGGACQGNYGSAFPHQAERTVVPVP